jgi:hypothetical protein|tara:strand:+ start:1039 stop:1302 length:264 start_codon:yes stop_codon:yes gene_type:complete
MTYQINLNSTTTKAFKKIFDLDMTLVNSEDYLGVCYFWDHDYRHTGLRDASVSKRKRVHNALMNAGLDVTKASNDHLNIINEMMGAK